MQTTACLFSLPGAISTAPARVMFSSSVEPLLHAASPAAAGNIRRQGHHCGHYSIRPSAASNTLLPTDFDLQESLMVADVRKILHQRQKNARQMMVTIDNLKRLCVDHYFKEEIESAMTACMDLIHRPERDRP